MPIEVRGLTHTYMPGTPFESHALKNVSFNIEDGSFVGIIGHTGSGKSTLITHLNALSKSDAGMVFVNGIDLGEKETDLRAIRKTVGIVFQYPEYQLFEETVAKDIAFGPRNLQLDEAEIDSRVKKAMQLIGLDGKYAEHSPFELSGGQKRRVAIAGVLAMEPQILILDEPAAGLDPIGRRQMLDLIEDIHNSGVTVIMVSHSMDDVGKYCDKLIVLNHGEIALQGDPREIFRHGEALRNIGLDVPETVKLADSLRAKGYDIPENVFEYEELLQAITELLTKD